MRIKPCPCDPHSPLRRTFPILSSKYLTQMHTTRIRGCNFSHFSPDHIQGKSTISNNENTRRCLCVDLWHTVARSQHGSHVRPAARGMRAPLCSDSCRSHLRAARGSANGSHRQIRRRMEHSSPTPDAAIAPFSTQRLASRCNTLHRNSVKH